MTREGVLNLGIAGNGMFAVARPDATGGAGESETYTRVGEFSLDSEGFIRSNDGSYLLGVLGAGGLASGPSDLAPLKILP